MEKKLYHEAKFHATGACFLIRKMNKSIEQDLFKNKNYDIINKTELTHDIR